MADPSRADRVKQKRLDEIARKFQRDMEKLGVGVRIKAGDGPWIKVTDPPKKPGTKPPRNETPPPEPGEQA